MVGKSSERVEKGRKSIEIGERMRIDGDLLFLRDGDYAALGAAGDRAGEVEEGRELRASGDEKRVDRRELFLGRVDECFEGVYFRFSYALIRSGDLGLYGKEVLLDRMDDVGEGFSLMRESRLLCRDFDYAEEGIRLVEAAERLGDSGAFRHALIAIEYFGGAAVSFSRVKHGPIISLCAFSLEEPVLVIDEVEEGELESGERAEDDPVSAREVERLIDDEEGENDEGGRIGPEPVFEERPDENGFYDSVRDEVCGPEELKARRKVRCGSCEVRRHEIARVFDELFVDEREDYLGDVAREEEDEPEDELCRRSDSLEYEARDEHEADILFCHFRDGDAGAFF